jgi:hypothetical protein
MGEWLALMNTKGDAITFLILDSLMNLVVHWPEFHSDETGFSPNFHAEVAGHFPSDGGECPAHKHIMSTTDLAGLDIDPSELTLPQFSSDELVVKVFVRGLDDRNNYRAKVVCKLQDHDAACFMSQEY